MQGSPYNAVHSSSICYIQYHINLTAYYLPICMYIYYIHLNVVTVELPHWERDPFSFTDTRYTWIVRCTLWVGIAYMAIVIMIGSSISLKVVVARTLFDRAMKISSQARRGAPEQRLPQKACSEELASVTMLTTAQAQPTHSHSHPTIRPSSIWDHPKDIGLTQLDLHIFLAPSNTSTDGGEAEGPYTPTTKSWCGLPNPVWFMFHKCTFAKRAGLWNTA